MALEPLPPFKIIKLDDLKVYKKYEIYDDYLRETNKIHYDSLEKPQLEEKNGITIDEQMKDAIRFFASKGIGELTQILHNFNIEDDIKNGLKEYFGSLFSNMNASMRKTIAKNKLTNDDLDLDFKDIIEIYDKLKNPAPPITWDNEYDTYIYNTLNAFTKTTPCTAKFCVFRCYQKLHNGAPLLTPEGNLAPYIYLNQFTSTSILLRLCDYWCTPDPESNVINSTDLYNLNKGENTIICIEIPESTRGISLINYLGLVSDSFTSDYSEFEYLLPPGGYLTLTNRTYEYTSITRTNLRTTLKIDPTKDDPFPHLPTTFKIPVYTYMSNVADNPYYEPIPYKKYSYILPEVKNIFSRTREYIKDRINVIKNKAMTITKTKKEDALHSDYVAFKDGKGKQRRKQTRKRKRKDRIQSRKRKNRIQSRKRNTRQKKNKNKKINYKHV
jgi:hypothetical protein